MISAAGKVTAKVMRKINSCRFPEQSCERLNNKEHESEERRKCGTSYKGNYSRNRGSEMKEGALLTQSINYAEEHIKFRFTS
jgi:hypothetical protein